MDLQWLESGEMPPEDLDNLSRNLAFHLKHLVDERDTQLEVVAFKVCCLLQFYFSFYLYTGFCMPIGALRHDFANENVGILPERLCGKFSLFAITTREQLQEGRVETVNLFTKRECVCSFLRKVIVSINEFPTQRDSDAHV